MGKRRAYETQKDDQVRTTTAKLTSDIGALVRRFRQDLQLSQSDFGDVVEINQSAISALERGTYRPDPLRLCARIVGRLGGEIEISVMLRGNSGAFVRWTPDGKAPTSHPAVPL